MAEGVFPELSYKIVGIAFKIFNESGYGFPENYYQKVFSTLLNKEKIPHQREKCIQLTFAGEKIGKYFIDFLVDNKIVVELKVRPSIGYTNIRQVMGYLKSGQYWLAILIYFTRQGIKYRRILNSDLRTST